MLQFRSVQKNWNERFERAESKPRTWRVFVGAIILIAKIGHILMTDGDLMSRLDIWVPNNYEAIGYDLASTLAWPLAVWLIVSGAQARPVRLPPEPGRPERRS